MQRLRFRRAIVAIATTAVSVVTPLMSDATVSSGRIRSTDTVAATMVTLERAAVDAVADARTGSLATALRSLSAAAGHAVDLDTAAAPAAGLLRIDGTGRDVSWANDVLAAISAVSAGGSGRRGGTRPAPDVFPMRRVPSPGEAENDPSSTRHASPVPTTWPAMSPADPFASVHTLARAIDDIVADARRSVAPRTSFAAVSPCDTLNVPPLVCVGGVGNNVHKDEYVLSIDLGGNDRYVNSAGGADAPIAVQGAEIKTKVVIDLAGNDVYRSLLGRPGGPRVAQGAGIDGAVGVLVDAAGNDRYEIGQARTRFAGTPLRGQGIGVHDGLGILADLSGNDRYSIRASTHADAAQPIQGAIGQGAALVGTGLLLDAAGDDTYDLSSVLPSRRAARDVVQPGRGVAMGLGAAVSGTGIHVDGGGRDRATITSKRTTPEGDYVISWMANTFALAAGFGYSVDGVGLAFSGPGDTTRTLRAAASGGAQAPPARTAGFGTAMNTGLAAIADVDGRDRYHQSARVTGAYHVRQDGQIVPEFRGPKVRITLYEYDAMPGSDLLVGALALGPGFGWGDHTADLAHIRPATGLALDLGGDDVFANDTDARGTVNIVRGGDPDATAEVGTPGGPAVAYTHAVGASGGIAGVRNEGGNDVYATTSRGGTRVRGAPAFKKVQVVGSPAVSFCQAVHLLASNVFLHDTGGRDTYRCAATTSATAGRAHHAQRGGSGVLAQGAAAGIAGSAYLLDVDRSERDTFVTRPEDPACQGTKGSDEWSDCTIASLTGGRVVDLAA